MAALPSVARCGVLVVVLVPGAHPLRLPLVKRITSIGSDPPADIRLATGPPRWAVVHRGDAPDGRVPGWAAGRLPDRVARGGRGAGGGVPLDDIGAHSRYGAIPSVTALGLGRALCLPMRLDGRTLGCVFLATHGRATVDE